MLKRIALALVVLAGLAVASEAQESYTISVTVNQQARVTRSVNVQNQTTCIRLNQPAACTQAQACVAANAAGGASCTAAQARQANARIYPNTQPGREEFATAVFAKDVNEMINNAVALDQSQWCVAFKAASLANQNSACTVVGYTSPCEPCP